MTEFTIILEDGTLYKNVFVKLENVFAKTNEDIYWFLKRDKKIQVFINKANDSDIFVGKKEIYYFTTSKQYQ